MRQNMQFVGAAAAVVIVAALFPVFHRPPLPPPVVASHFKFTVTDVHSETIPADTYARMKANGVPPPPREQVWVKVRIDYADNYHDSSTNRPSLEPTSLVPDAQLIAPDGTRLPMFKMDSDTDTFWWSRLRNHGRGGGVSAFYAVYGFDNAAHAARATLIVNVHVDPYDPNLTRNSETAPFIRPARFENIAIR